MRSIDQIFRLDSTSNRFGGAVPVTRGVKTTPDDERANLGELERAYIEDPTIHNGVNKFVSVIKSGGLPSIVGHETTVSFMDDFLDGLGERGGNTSWKSLLTTIFKHQAVYGSSYNEVIFDKSGVKPLDVDFIDPKKMDYAKDNMRKIVLDKFSNPVGYVETVPFADVKGSTRFLSDPKSKEVSLQHNQIFFKPERIAHFKFSEIGDGFYPIGLIEPILKTSNRKLTMMEALAEVYLRAGFPTRIFKVGDEQHTPSDELMESTAAELEKSSYKSTFAVPYYVDPIIVEAKNAEKLKEHLKYFVEEEVTVLGPKSFVTGLGDQMNKATLNRLEFLYKLTMKDIMDNTAQIIERKIFAPIAKAYNLPDVPKLIWGEINLEELDSKAERLVSYVGVGLLTADRDIEKLIRKSEGLPEDFERREEKQEAKNKKDENVSDNGGDK